MVIKNPTYHLNNKIEWDDKKKFFKQVNLYDKAVVDYSGNVFEGFVTFISDSGINITTTIGDRFFKWFHIKEIHKED